MAIEYTGFQRPSRLASTTRMAQALTALLPPSLLAPPRGRVVTMTSFAHGMGRIDFDSLDGSKSLY